jgi:hypothetical protein
MTTCPACGTQNPVEAVFCQGCGTKLKESAAAGAAAYPPPPVQPAPGNYPQTPPPYPPAAPYYPVQRPLKQKSTAMLLEILLGLFGLYGFGRIYSGDTQTGIIWLIGGIIWSIIAIIIDVATAGFGFLCTVPVNIACVVICALTLDSYAKKHPEIFGA